MDFDRGEDKKVGGFHKERTTISKGFACGWNGHFSLIAFYFGFYSV